MGKWGFCPVTIWGQHAWRAKQLVQILLYPDGRAFVQVLQEPSMRLTPRESDLFIRPRYAVFRLADEEGEFVNCVILGLENAL